MAGATPPVFIMWIVILIFLTGCTTYSHQATIRVKKDKVEFYSKNSQFQAKVKNDKIEAEYNSQKPSLIEDVLKATVIKEVNK